MNGITRTKRQNASQIQGVTIAQPGLESDAQLFTEFESLLDKIAARVTPPTKRNQALFDKPEFQTAIDEVVATQVAEKPVVLEKSAATSVEQQNNADVRSDTTVQNEKPEQDSSASDESRSEREAEDAVNVNDDDADDLVSQNSSNEEAVKVSQASSENTARCAKTESEPDTKVSEATEVVAPLVESSQEQVVTSEQAEVPAEVEQEALQTVTQTVDGDESPLSTVSGEGATAEQACDASQTTAGVKSAKNSAEVAADAPVQAADAVTTDVVAGTGEDTSAAAVACDTTANQSAVGADTTKGSAKSDTQNAVAEAARIAAATAADAAAVLQVISNDTRAILKNVAELVTSRISEVKASMNFTASNGIGEGSVGIRGTDAQRREEPRARQLSKVSAAATMEKVEAALKEVAKSKDGKTISVRLDPPSLGSVKADVSLRDGNLHARLVAESPQVQQLLQERAHELQGLLRKLGLAVESVTVAVHGDDAAKEGFLQFSTDHRSSGEWSSERDVDAQSEDFERSVVRETPVEALDHWIA